MPAFTVAHLDVPHRQPAEERLPQLQVITIITININITHHHLPRQKKGDLHQSFSRRVTSDPPARISWTFNGLLVDGHHPRLEMRQHLNQSPQSIPLSQNINIIIVTFQNSFSPSQEGSKTISNYSPPSSQNINIIITSPPLNSLSQVGSKKISKL